MYNELFVCATDNHIDSKGKSGKVLPLVSKYYRLVGAFVALAAAVVLMLTGCADNSSSDVTAPTVTSVRLISATATSAVVSVTANEIGKFFWVAYTDGSAPADAAALVAVAGGATSASIVANSGRDGVTVSTAGEAVTVSVGGLTEFTNYDFYAIAQDAAGNLSARSAKLDIRTTDATAPMVTEVRFISATATSAMVSVTANEIGKFFWVAYADSSAPADAAALVAAAGGVIGAPIVANSGRDDFTVSTAGEAVTVSIGGLTEFTDYDFYAIAQDAAGNLSARSAKLDIRTTDATAPMVTEVRLVSATATSAMVSVTASEIGKFFWVAYADGSTPDNAAALVAAAGGAIGAPIVAVSGSDGVTVPTAGGAITVSVGGLDEFTNYDFYAIARDAAGNLSALSAKLDIRTADATAPTVTEVRFVSATATRAVVSVTANEIGKFFWVAYADGSAPADAAALVAAAGGAIGAPIVAVSGSGGVMIPTAGEAVTVSVGGLDEFTNYDFYAVAQDAAGNLSALSAKLDILTADETAPIISAIKLGPVVGTAATVTLNVNETGVLFWVVYADGSAPANATALIADAAAATSTTIITNSGGSGQVVSAVGEAEISITGLAANMDYDFYVVARDASSNVSDLSTVLNVKTALTVPDLTAINLVSIEGTTLRLTWTNPDPTADDLTQIGISWGAAASHTISTGLTEGEQLSYDVTGLTPNTAYTFSFVASYGDSLSSTVVAITRTPVEVDGDNDNLIDIHNLDMLNNVRHNLAGTFYAETAGAATGLQCSDSGTTACTGYELVRSLDFADAASYVSGSVNGAWRPTNSGTVVAPASATNAGWDPIGTSFTGIFDGKGNSVSNLYVRSSGNAGLFEQLSGTVRSLGVVAGNVYGSSRIGILSGQMNANSRIVASYATGSATGISGTGNHVGGLVGLNADSVIVASYATAIVSGGPGADDYVGGLVGYVSDNDPSASVAITASYASGGTASGGTGIKDRVGGLVGGIDSGQAIASYADISVNAGTDTRDDGGSLFGLVVSKSTASASIASYGFGSVTTRSPITGEDSSGSDPRLTSASGITGAHSGCINSGSTLSTMSACTNISLRWITWATEAGGAWDFATGKAPALKYEDYDGAGTVYSCDQFPGGVCGALIPGQR